MNTDKQKLEALVYVLSKQKFHILECHALAKTLGAETTMIFDVVGPAGRMPCKWIDANYGLFERTDKDSPGAFHLDQFQFLGGIHCENLEGF